MGPEHGIIARDHNTGPENGTLAWEQIETTAWDQSTGAEHETKARDQGMGRGRNRARDRSMGPEHGIIARDHNTGP
jgi:hypothetical protein